MKKSGIRVTKMYGIKYNPLQDNISTNYNIIF